MVNSPDPRAEISANLATVSSELDWLDRIIATRFAAYGDDKSAGSAEEIPEPPSLAESGGAYASLVRELSLSADDRLTLILTLAPYLAPERLDPFLIQNVATGRPFTEFGGVNSKDQVGFLPSALTANFLINGNRSLTRDPFEILNHPLVKRGIVVVDHRQSDEPQLSGGLKLSPQGLHYLLYDEDYLPPTGSGFPASRVSTPLDWSDLVLDSPTIIQVEMIASWIRHSKTLMEDWGLARRLKPGYRCLFHGPPGTGKTLTASLLGKLHNLPVYRVDLSQIVSKWIGETEKNLAALFDQAQDRNWILFFDEADALFGKRTESRSSNDRSANQQIAYLLQRLENHAGITILATNQTAHMDEAFSRRFQSTILFPMPDKASRLRLWRDTFSSPGFTLAPEIDFANLAENYELSGGGIINVLRHAALLAVQRDPATVELRDLIDGIRLELKKDGRYLA
tara:strand:- start:21051 stop:22415 length:1365 start_codon:yes stop_codon:yes gene_type:complete